MTPKGINHVTTKKCDIKVVFGAGWKDWLHRVKEHYHTEIAITCLLGTTLCSKHTTLTTSGYTGHKFPAITGKWLLLW